MEMRVSIASPKALYPFSCVVQLGFVNLFYNLEFGIDGGYLRCREMSQYGLGFLPYIYLYCYFPAVDPLCSFIVSLLIYLSHFPQPLKYRPESCLDIEGEIQSASISHT